MKNLCIQSFSGPYFSAFGQNMERYSVSISPYSARMWGNTDQKNSEDGHFSRSVTLYDVRIFHLFLELTHITPAFEKEESNWKHNYRLVSILPNILKIFNDVRFDKFKVLRKRFYQNINVDLDNVAVHNFVS